MISKKYGQLLFNAVRETLETMAFADVVPCSIKIGDEECSQESHEQAVTGWGDDIVDASDKNADVWGTVLSEPAIVNPSGFATSLGGDDSWGSDEDVSGGETAGGGLDATDWQAPEADDAWAEPPKSPAMAGWADPEEDAWGTSGIIAPDADPWGEGAAVEQQVENLARGLREEDFEQMVSIQDDWSWACMKVNSPEVHSVWFIVSKNLARALAENMYAGEHFELDAPLIRDLIAELTNVLGGRLMLLLEEMGGQFTLTVPEIGFGMPEIPESQLAEAILCKIVVDGEYPVIVALCFNQ